MKKRLEKKVKAVLDLDLPQGQKIISESRKIASDLKIGRSAFMDRWGVVNKGCNSEFMFEGFSSHNF